LPEISCLARFPVDGMGYKAKKTEHSGSKKGCGSYWGRKGDAKKQSSRKRREDGKMLIRDTKRV
jgi:hypothetical protein